MPPFHIALSIFAIAIVGGNFVATKIGIHSFPPFFFVALRFALVAALLAPFLRKPRAMPIRDMLPFSLLFALNFSLGTAAMGQGLDVATTVIVVQLMVPLSCLMGAWMFKEHIGPWRWGGMIIAFIGVALVAGTPNAAGHPLGFALIIAAAIVGALFNVAMKRYGSSGFDFMAWMSLLAAPQLLLFSMWRDGWDWLPVLQHASVASWCALAYTVVFNTLLAHGIIFYLLKRNPISATAPFSLLAPVFGLHFSQWFFDEQLTQKMMIGAGLTLLGVAVIVLRRPKLAVPEQG